MNFNWLRLSQAESPNQTIKIEQSQSDRSKKVFNPVPLVISKVLQSIISNNRILAQFLIFIFLRISSASNAEQARTKYRSGNVIHLQRIGYSEEIGFGCIAIYKPAYALFFINLQMHCYLRTYRCRRS